MRPLRAGLHRYDQYVAALHERGVTDLEPYRSYLDTFRYGMPPTAGSPSVWRGSWPG